MQDPTTSDPEIAALLRRRRNTARAIVAGLGAAVVIGAGAFAWGSTRLVTIVGPTGGARLAVGDGKPAHFPSRVGLVVELRPGTHAVHSDDPSIRDSIEVPVLARGLVVPARDDHCLIVASASGAYTFDGGPPPTSTGDAFHILDRSAESFTVPVTSARTVIDPCMLPHRLDALEDVHVTYAVPCDDAPPDDEKAAEMLLSSLLLCPSF